MIATLAALPLLLTQDPLPPFPNLIEQVRLDTWAEILLKTDALPGFSVGIMRGDRQWFGGYGETYPGSGVTPDKLTRYEIGSITKVFTGVLLAEMAEREEVHLSQPLRELMPSNIKVPDTGEHPILLWHLATHTSGLPRLPNNLDRDPTRPYEKYTSNQLVTALQETHPPSIPGRLYSYSNFGTGLLGALLALQAKTSFERLLAERVLSPLGLFHTQIARTTESQARMAPPFAAGQRPVEPWLFDVMAPCGGLISSTEDLLAFLRSHFTEMPGELGKALQKATEVAWTNPRDSLDMGLGWHRNRANGALFHNGQTGGYHSFMALDLENEIAVVVLANSSSILIEDWASRAFQLLRQDDRIAPMNYRLSPALEATERAKFVGRYHVGILGDLEIAEIGERLFSRLSGQEWLRMYPDADDVFFYRDVEAEIHFHRDDTGKPNEFELQQAGRHFVGERLDDE